MKFLLILTINFLTIACAVKQNDRLSDNDLTFESFFTKFSNDSTFQATRIDFPLEYLFYTVDSDELQTKRIENETWHYVDFADDSLARKRSVDAFEVKWVKRDSSNIEYQLTGIDNGISIKYYFSKRKGRWYLTKVVNESN
jgi:hypothetical protein